MACAEKCVRPELSPSRIKPPTSDRPAFAPVTGKSMRPNAEIIVLTLKSADGRFETIRTTPNHPFLRAAANDNTAMMVADGASALVEKIPPPPSMMRLAPAGLWTIASLLAPGDQLASLSGAKLTRIMHRGQRLAA